MTEVLRAFRIAMEKGKREKGQISKETDETDAGRDASS